MNPNEVTNMWQRIIAAENKNQSYDAFFKNFTSRLDSHGVEINKLKSDLLKESLDRASLAKSILVLKAGLDTLLAQVKPTKPKFKFPWQ